MTAVARALGWRIWFRVFLRIWCVGVGVAVTLFALGLTLRALFIGSDGLLDLLGGFVVMLGVGAGMGGAIGVPFAAAGLAFAYVAVRANARPFILTGTLAGCLSAALFWAWFRFPLDWAALPYAAGFVFAGFFAGRYLDHHIIQQEAPDAVRPD